MARPRPRSRSSEGTCHAPWSTTSISTQPSEPRRARSSTDRSSPRLPCSTALVTSSAAACVSAIRSIGEARSSAIQVSSSSRAVRTGSAAPCSATTSARWDAARKRAATRHTVSSTVISAASPSAVRCRSSNVVSDQPSPAMPPAGASSRGSMAGSADQEHAVAGGQRAGGRHVTGAPAGAERPASRVAEQLGRPQGRDQQGRRVSRRGVGRGPAVRVEHHDDRRGAASGGHVVGVQVGELEGGDDVAVATQPGVDHGAHLRRRDRRCQPQAGCLSDDEGEPVVGEHDDVEPAPAGFGGVARDEAVPVQVEHRQHGYAGGLDRILEGRHEVEVVALLVLTHLGSSSTWVLRRWSRPLR